MRNKENTFNKDTLNKLLLGVLSVMPTVALINSSNIMFSKMVLIIELLLLLAMTVINHKAITKKELIILMLNLFSLVMTLSSHSAFGSAVMFINALLCFKIFNNIVVERRTFISIHIINGVLISLYVFLIKRPLYTGNTIADAFNNRINTNMISILYLCAFLHLACVILSVIDKKGACWILLMIPSFIYGENIWFYESRSAMISMIAFVILVIVASKKKLPYIKYKKICTITLVASLAFPFIYLAIFKMIGISELFGKGIGSRSVVWRNCIDLIKQYPIWGNGNDMLVVMNVNGKLSYSMHNTLLSLWKVLGIIPTVTFIIFCVQHDNQEYDDKRNIIAQITFISTLPVCFFESFLTEELLYMAFLPFLITNVKEIVDESR